MEVSTALELIDTLIYKPGWTFSATDHTNRYEGSIILRIDYPARNTDRDQAPDYPVEINTYAQEPILVADCRDVVDLCRQVLRVIDAIDEHEARESLRVAPSNWAPFHPHKVDGMKRWGCTETDLKFGIG